MLKTFFHLIRFNHWIKNFFVIAPLIFALKFFDREAVLKSVIAFFAFSFISSFNYIINDIRDREKDAFHSLKKNRPVASGKISPAVASIVGAAFIIIASTLSLGVNIHFTFILAVYAGMNLLYSYHLKNVVIIDVMIIAVGFVLRVIAGSVAIDVPYSNWILLTTLFISLFLGFGKRRHEMSIMGNSMEHRPVLKYYSIQLLDYLIIISAALTIITYALYTVDPENAARFKTNKLIYTVPFVIYGILKYLVLLFKERKGGDPADIVLHDRSILADIFLWGVTIMAIFLYTHYR